MYLTMIYDKEKQQILSFEMLEPQNVFSHIYWDYWKCWLFFCWLSNQLITFQLYISSWISGMLWWAFPHTSPSQFIDLNDDQLINTNPD